MEYFSLPTPGDTRNDCLFPAFQVFHVFLGLLVAFQRCLPQTTHENGGVKYFFIWVLLAPWAFFFLFLQYYGLCFRFRGLAHTVWDINMGKGVSFSFLHNGFPVLSRSWLFVSSRFEALVQQARWAGDGFVQHHPRGLLAKEVTLYGGTKDDR